MTSIINHSEDTSKNALKKIIEKQGKEQKSACSSSISLKTLSENSISKSNLRVLSKVLRKYDPILGWLYRNENQITKIMNFDYGFHGAIEHKALLLRSLEYLSNHSLYKKFKDMMAMHQTVYIDPTDSKIPLGLEGHFKADLIIIRPGKRFIWLECGKLTRTWDEREKLIEFIQKEQPNDYEFFFFHTIWQGDENVFEHHPKIWEIIFPEIEKEKWIEIIKEMEEKMSEK